MGMGAMNFQFRTQSVMDYVASMALEFLSFLSMVYTLYPAMKSVSGRPIPSKVAAKLKTYGVSRSLYSSVISFRSKVLASFLVVPFLP